jgi:thiamine-phosphate pyrophosphorylase
MRAIESSSRERSLAARRLYLITGARPDLTAFLEAAIRGGVDFVQVREKALDDRDRLALISEAREVTGRLGVPLVVNDRIDLALLAGADYVHVAQRDLPVPIVRAFGLRVGLSTHSPGQLDQAEADYCGVGPVFATPTKPGRPPVGLDLIRYAARAARANPGSRLAGSTSTTPAP